jgi:hypothetical protein
MNEEIKSSDWLGIVSSGLCLVHCLITPLLIGTWVFASHQIGWLEHFELIFVTLSLVAVYFTTRQTPFRLVRILLWSFFGLLIVGTVGEYFFEKAEYFIYVASLGIMISHIYNIRVCRKCKSE